ALRLDMARLRVQARADLLPSLFAGLLPTLRSRTQQRGSLTRRLAGASEIERRQAVLDLVREQVAVVLGYSSPREVDSQRAFKDAGFTSLNAIQLRNSLGQITGLRLPATLTFDYPDSEAVAGYLLGRLEGETDRRTPLERDLDRLEEVLRSSAIDTDERRRINARLRALMGADVDGQETNGASISARIESASMDDIFDVIDEQLEKR
ncbi:MAG TPA: phosphopantetheine-binding protein, partial [Solirubrobacteraceae bacterium]|nr:phosphopantetheine-binding protein [Solirubrobacteraceae bacterium]